MYFEIHTIKPTTMEQMSLKTIVGSLLLLIFTFCVGFHYGQKNEQKKQSVKVETSTETLKNHEKIIDTIRTESDSAAYNRFKHNFGTK